MAIEEEEYELVPLSPLRKMDKRIERLEKSGTSQEMVKELIDVVRTNQQIVDDIVKINSDTINKIMDLTSSVNNMITKLDEFVSRIEVTGEEKGGTAEAVALPSNVDARLDKLEKRINTLLLATAAKSKFRHLPRRPVSGIPGQ